MPTDPSPQPYDSSACPESKLQEKIDTLESQSIDQDVLDKKAQLASVKKIYGEVEQAEIKYKQEYLSLQLAFEQFGEYVTNRAVKIDNNTTDSERKRIQQIVACEDKRIGDLEKQWKDARAKVPGFQQAYAAAVIGRADAEEIYRASLKYRTDADDLAALQTQSTTQIEKQNYRAAYYLVEGEMHNLVKPPASPEDFNTALENVALGYFDASDKERQAKTQLDQGTADSQKKKKAYDDAVAKRRDNILKLIADEPFGAADTNESQGSEPGASNA